ncbi:hypothetical protein [Nocardia puris]|uniref:hypothetical protein n=1 Tax=Nocardia puris TaxID=208602 RepID=UPI002E1C60F2
MSQNAVINFTAEQITEQVEATLSQYPDGPVKDAIRAKLAAGLEKFPDGASIPVAVPTDSTTPPIPTPEPERGPVADSADEDQALTLTARLWSAYLDAPVDTATVRHLFALRDVAQERAAA